MSNHLNTTFTSGVKYSNAWPFYAWYAIIDPVEGSMLDMPFEAEDGNFTIPAAAGKYYYHYTYKNTDGFVEVKSDADLGENGGAYLVVRVNGTVDTRSYGRVALRKRIGNDWGSNDTECFVCVNKENATESAETLTFAEVELAAGDTPANPMEFEGETVTTPDFSSVYYYKFTAPEGDKQYAVVDARTTGMTNASKIQVTPIDNQYTALGEYNAYNYVKAPVEGGKEYMIIVTNKDGKAISFNFNFAEILPGNMYDKPIEASAEEENVLNAGNTYYSYTATVTGWLKVDAGDAAIKPVFMKDDTGYYFYTSTLDGTGYMINAQEGTSYVFKFEYIKNEGKFSISERAYFLGEHQDNPIIAEEGDNETPQAAGNAWFKYTVQNNSMLTMTTDMKYGKTEDGLDYTQFQVLAPGETYASNYYDSNAGAYIRTCPAQAETDYLMNVHAIDANGYILTITESPFNELPTIELNGKFTIASISNKAYAKWYYISFPSAGTFTIGGAEGGKEYNQFELYTVDNITTNVAKTAYVMDDNGYHYELTYEVPEAGEYILGQVGGNACTVYTTWNGDDVTGINNVNANSNIVEVYDITGRKVAKVGNRGIFIIKTADGQTKKVNVSK